MSDTPAQLIARHALKAFETRARRLPPRIYREALVELLAMLEDLHQAAKETEETTTGGQDD